MSKTGTVSFIKISNSMFIVYCLTSFFPLMRVLPINRSYIGLVCALVIVTCYLFDVVFRRNTIKKQVLFILLVLSALIVFPFLAGNGVISHRYIGTSMVFIAPIVFDYYKEKNSLGDLKNILLFVGVFALLTGIITYYKLLGDAYVSRAIKANEQGEALSRQGVGGYDFIYALVATGLLFLFISSVEKKLFRKIGGFSVFVFCLLLILKANFLTAFIVYILCSLLMVFLILSRGKSVKTKILLFLTATFFFVLLCNINGFLRMIEGVLPSRIAKVINSNENNIVQSVYSNFVIDRFPEISSSINAFFANPILGLALSDKLQYSNGYLVGFGQHSFVFDTFALYGLGLGICCVIIIFIPFRYYRHDIVNALSIPIMVCMVLLYFLNNATESIAIVIGVGYPLVRELYSSNFTVSVKKEV